jgi:MYXO-CTERM domain-containing protein
MTMFDAMYWRMPIAAAAAAVLSGCSGGGGLGCGGATDGPVYEYPAEGPIIAQSLQVHVSDVALSFIEDNAGDIIGDLAGGGGGGLSFCVPPVDLSFAGEICGNSRCDDGTTGCQAEIILNDVKATPYSETPSDRLAISVAISLGSPLQAEILFSNCGITLDPPVPVTANVYFEVEPALTGRTAIRLPADRIEIDTAAIIDSLQINGGAGCTITGGAIGLLGGALGGLIEGALIGPLQDAIDPLLCQTCETDICPFGSTCDDAGICIEDGAEQCVPIELGLETEIDLGDLLSSFAPGLEAALGINIYLANYADANGPAVTPQYGLDLAGEAGFYAEPNACVPYQDPPSVSRVAKSAELNTNVTPDGEPFGIGIGLSESALELALWGVYRSGALCLAIGSDVSDLVSTGTFAAFLPSLAQLVDNENRPLSLVLRPQIAPTVTLGEGTLAPNPMGPPTIVDPLITLELKQVEIDFYTIMEDRWVRAFTLDTDIEVPLALNVNAANEIEVLLGDLAEALTRVEAVNGELLAAEEVDNIASILPGLIGGLLPSLLGDGGLIPPIAIPDLAGFQILFGDNAFTSVESNTMLAIFANLDYVGSTGGALMGSLQPIILGTDVVWERANPAELVSQARFDHAPVDIRELTPTVILDMQTDTFNVDSPGVEYAYRFDRGMWSLWHRGDDLVINDARLALQGRHNIEVRVREIGDTRTTSVQTAATTILVDYQAPTVRLSLDDQLVVVDARDTVAYPSELSMRYRINNGDWSSEMRVYETIDLSAVSGRAFVEVQVEDVAGNVTTRREAFHTTEAPLELSTDEVMMPVRQPTGSDDNRGQAAGCAVAAGESSAPVSAGWFFGALGVALLARRRRSLRFGAVGAVSLALLLTACGDDRGNNIVEGSAEPPAGCDPACAEGQTCVDGICLGCVTNDDCEAGFLCTDGTCTFDDSCTGDQDCPDGQRCQESECVEVECTSDADCSCDTYETPSCVGDVCQCAPPCEAGCGEGEACCLPDSACVPVSATCAATECPIGTSLQAVADPQFDDEACSATVECECVELPPLQPGNIGRYLDVAVDGDTKYFVAYNTTYGDLMYGIAGADDAIEWTYLDGVPATGTVTGNLNGPREGRAFPGPDAGLYPSVEVSAEGRVMMSYQYVAGEEARIGLNFAVSTAADKSFFSPFVVDSSPGAGLWSNLLLDDAGLPMIIYSVPVYDAASRVNATEIRLLHGTVAHPASVDDFAAPVVLDAAVSTIPCGGLCAGRDLCRLDANVCARSERASACDPGCAEGEECFAAVGGEGNVCSGVEPPPALTYFPTGSATFLDATLSSDGVLYVASYDGSAGNLRLVTHTVGTEDSTSMILDGEADLGEGVEDTGNVGLFPDVLVREDGSLLVTYMDGDMHSLLAWDSVSNTVAVVDSGYRCFNYDAGISQCRELLTARVGGDSQLVENAGQVVVYHQDATQHDIIAFTLGASGWDAAFIQVAGDEDPYAGAMGFYLVHDEDAAGEFVAGYRLNNRADPASRNVDIIRVP